MGAVLDRNGEASLFPSLQALTWSQPSRLNGFLTQLLLPSLIQLTVYDPGDEDGGTTLESAFERLHESCPDLESLTFRTTRAAVRIWWMSCYAIQT